MTPPNAADIDTLLRDGLKPAASHVASLMGDRTVVRADPRHPARLLYERDDKVVGYGPADGITRALLRLPEE